MLLSYKSAFLAVGITLAALAEAQDANDLACSTLDIFYSICNSYTPGFTSFTNFKSQAPCLCYGSTAWVPGVFDGLVQSCFSALRTESPAAYSMATASLGGDFVMTPCARAGNVLGATATDAQTIIGPTNSGASSTSMRTSASTSASSPASSSPASSSSSGSGSTLVTSSRSTITSAPATTAPGILACNSIAAGITYCNSATPGFSTLDFTSQAPCFCYDASTSFAPTFFDNAWSTCVSYLSASSSSVYATLSSEGAPVTVSNPCEVAGDVLATKTSSTVRTTTSSAAPGGGGGVTSLSSTPITSGDGLGAPTPPASTTSAAPRPNDAGALKANLGLVVEIVAVVLLL